MKRVLISLLLLALLFAFLIYPILVTFLFKTMIKNEFSRRYKGLEIEVKIETTPFFIFSSRFDRVSGKISSNPEVETNFEFIKFNLRGVKVKVPALLRGKSASSSISWRRLTLSGSSTIEQVNSFIDSQGFPLRIESSNGKILATPLGVRLPWLFGDKERIILFDPQEKEKSLEKLLKILSEGFLADLDQVAINEIRASTGRIDWELEIKARNFLSFQNFMEGF